MPSRAALDSVYPVSWIILKVSGAGEARDGRLLKRLPKLSRLV
jgi:hypothetical protein